MKIGRLRGIKKFTSERENFMFNAFINFQAFSLWRDFRIGVVGVNFAVLATA